MANDERNANRSEHQVDVARDLTTQIHEGNITSFVRGLNDRLKSDDTSAYNRQIDDVNAGLFNGFANWQDRALADAYGAKLSGRNWPKLRIDGLAADKKNLLVNDGCIEAVIAPNATVVSTRNIDAIAREEALKNNRILRPSDVIGAAHDPLSLPGYEEGNPWKFSSHSKKLPDGSTVTERKGEINNWVHSAPDSVMDRMLDFINGEDLGRGRYTPFKASEKTGADGRLLERHVAYKPINGWTEYDPWEKSKGAPQPLYPLIEIDSSADHGSGPTSVTGRVMSADSIYDSRTHMYKTSVQMTGGKVDIFSDNNGQVLFDAGSRSINEQNKCRTASGALKPGDRVDLNNDGRLSLYVPEKPQAAQPSKPLPPLTFGNIYN